MQCLENVLDEEEEHFKGKQCHPRNINQVMVISLALITLIGVHISPHSWTYKDN